MTHYYLVAYHRTKTERESLNTSPNLKYLKASAVSMNPIKYKNYNLVIETDGEAVVRFAIKDNKFCELSVR